MIFGLTADQWITIASLTTQVLAALVAIIA